MKTIISFLVLSIFSLNGMTQEFSYFKNDENIVAVIAKQKEQFYDKMKAQEEYLLSLNFEAKYLFTSGEYYIFKILKYFDFGGDVGSSSNISIIVFRLDGSIVDKFEFEEEEGENGGCQSEILVENDLIKINQDCEEYGYKILSSTTEPEEQAVYQELRNREIVSAYSISTGGKLVDFYPFSHVLVESQVETINLNFSKIKENYKDYKESEIIKYDSNCVSCYAQQYLSADDLKLVVAKSKSPSGSIVEYFYLKKNKLFLYYKVPDFLNSSSSTEYLAENKAIKGVESIYIYKDNIIKWLDENENIVKYSNSGYHNKYNEIFAKLELIRSSM